MSASPLPESVPNLNRPGLTLYRPDSIEIYRAGDIAVERLAAGHPQAKPSLTTRREAVAVYDKRHPRQSDDAPQGCETCCHKHFFVAFHRTQLAATNEAGNNQECKKLLKVTTIGVQLRKQNWLFSSINQTLTNHIERQDTSWLTRKGFWCLEYSVL
jgi:hypothetical protein